MTPVLPCRVFRLTLSGLGFILIATSVYFIVRRQVPQTKLTKEEVPTLQAYYDKYRQADFVIVAIHDGDLKADVLQFVKDYELTFPVWLDPTYIATEQAFNTLHLPTPFVIDCSGTIQLTWVGSMSADMLEAYVTPLVTEPS